jgi:hypothetical protein
MEDWHTGGKCRTYGQDSKRRNIQISLGSRFGPTRLLRQTSWLVVDDLEDIHSHIKVLEDRQSMVLRY